MQAQFLIGVAAAVFAAFSWSLNFVAPYVVGPYTIYDMAVTRFLLSGILGLLLFVAVKDQGARTATGDWLVAAWLGFVGYVGYFVTIMAAVRFAGPIIPPAIVATVPVVLAIAGNQGPQATSWRVLSLPLGFIALGLVMVNWPGLIAALNGLSTSVIAGVAISFGAVSLWTAFALSNRNALKKRPTMDPRKWTAMMMIGGAIEIALFVPVATHLSLLNFASLGLQWPSFGIILLSSLVLAAVGSIAGSWAWTIASKRLPIGLAGQLIVTETVFATSFGLVASRRWPTFNEAVGVGAIVCGVVLALKVLPSSTVEAQEVVT
ncbi:DMT family transporter [Paraburkholderia sp. J10-1]|uniref:DMT family transporter n=1 Tax=Paraburkholderia sp. J10-1 TaxID=2805430 RepID=UPI002AB759A1|nr:DMT family transporter [Paraburkholderia sp. J10-1]